MKEIEKHLTLIEEELKKLHLWEPHSPAPELLNSSQPFSIDTLEASQWLQWILLPKLKNMLDQQKKLPNSFCISPYFEQVYESNITYAHLVNLLTKLDEMIKLKAN